MEPISATILVKPAIALTTRLLKPLLARLEAGVSAKSQEFFHRLFNSYSQYLDRSFERHTYFNSIVFKNEQRKLEDYYIPLTLHQTKEKTYLKIISFPKNEIDTMRRLLIVDTAGMGKTTLLKFLFLSCVKEEAGIPIFIELRKLSKKKPLLDYILDQISDIQGKHQPDLFFKLLSSGDFVFFLDGYDEISEAERSAVTDSIQNLIEKAPNNRFLMTSREESGLAAFPSFQRYTVSPLEKEEAYTLLRKYADSSLAENLIAKLELPENSAIHEFLTNPLLTSLLFKSFEYKPIIPLKRHIFYRQVYEALFEMHDLTKEGGEFQRTKKSGLDVDRFEQLLRSFGALSYKEGRTEFTKDEALDLIKKAKALASETKAAPSNILHDLTHAVPLLVEDGNYVRWSHKSIQEYFAAQHICQNQNGKQIEILTKIYKENDSTKHINLLLLCADIDRMPFDQSIGRDIATELLSEFESSYKDIAITIPHADILMRKSLTVGRYVFLVDISAHQTTTEETVQSIMERMAKECSINYPISSSLKFGFPGVGAVHTRLASFINITKARLKLPFIVPAIFTHPSQISLSLGDEGFQRIVDAPSSPLNSPENFSVVNTVISEAFLWRFDADAAKKYLVSLNKAAEEKNKLEPW